MPLNSLDCSCLKKVRTIGKLSRRSVVCFCITTYYVYSYIFKHLISSPFSTSYSLSTDKLFPRVHILVRARNHYDSTIVLSISLLYNRSTYVSFSIQSGIAPLNLFVLTKLDVSAFILSLDWSSECVTQMSRESERKPKGQKFIKPRFHRS